MTEARDFSAAVIPQCVARLRRYVGAAVFMPCNCGAGGKGPIQKSWQTLTLSQMSAGHIRQCERPEYRIGVGLGRQSSGLCVLDCDCDIFLAEMLRLNPTLGETLTTFCNRGASMWLRVSDAWPPNKPLYRDGEQVGEWRATGNQSIIAGVDKKTGKPRRFLVQAPAIALPFNVLRWPDGIEDSGGKIWPAGGDTWETLQQPEHTIGDVEQQGTTTHLCSTSQGKAALERAQKTNRLYRDLLGHMETVAGQRNNFICRTVPFLYHAVSEPLIVAFSMRYFDERGRGAGWDEPRASHRAKVERLLEGLPALYVSALTAAERAIYDQLMNPAEQTTFRICRDCARRDDSLTGNPVGIFPMAYGELAARLSCANAVAEKILKGRFLETFHLVAVETAGLRRERGKPCVATRWRWKLPFDSSLTL